MKLSPFGFMHATNLRLGQPIDAVGSLSGADRVLAEEATFVAFRRVVDHCIQEDVEFLLLTGNSFDARHLTPKVQSELHDGLDRLSREGIPVFIVPGALDPSDVWRKSIDIPEGITFFDREDDEPVVVSSRGKDLCSVFPATLADADESRWRAEGPAVLQDISAPYQIGIVAAGSDIGWEQGPFHLSGTHTAAALTREAIDRGVNYLALGYGRSCQTHRLHSGIAHDPGSPQGLTANATGPHGCSLVRVSASGESTTRTLVTAPLRYETLTVQVDNDTTKDDLIAHMTLLLMDREPAVGEELWLVNWDIRGKSPLLSWIDEPNEQRELAGCIEKELGTGGPRRQHDFRLIDHVPSGKTPTTAPVAPAPVMAPQPAAPQAKPLSVASFPVTRDVEQERPVRVPSVQPVSISLRKVEATLWENLHEAMEKEGKTDLQRIRHDARESQWRDTTWGRPIFSLFEKADDDQLLEAAERLGREWLEETPPPGE
ncbi:MAG: hypothetical protein R3C01_11790 [Planctomycetaceae bacterium]